MCANLFFGGNHAIKQTFNRSAKNYVNYEARKSYFVWFLNSLIDFGVSFVDLDGIMKLRLDFFGY